MEEEGEILTTCSALNQFLRSIGIADSTRQAALAAHIRTCALCRKGEMELPQAIIPSSMLLQGHCATQHLATYYEATHSEYPQECMNDQQIVRVALHLALCSACREQFLELCTLSEMEERGGGENVKD
jgi:hypothetical protein